ncbi:hypothetical protein B0H11DRAFT_868417 [Mycena galericulata]|nr:hypothetical protein B0H11DRAFT_868417 [Mycena galericulata]
MKILLAEVGKLRDQKRASVTAGSGVDEHPRRITPPQRSRGQRRSSSWSLRGLRGNIIYPLCGYRGAARSYSRLDGVRALKYAPPPRRSRSSIDDYSRVIEILLPEGWHFPEPYVPHSPRPFRASTQPTPCVMNISYHITARHEQCVPITHLQCAASHSTVPPVWCFICGGIFTCFLIYCRSTRPFRFFTTRVPPASHPRTCSSPGFSCLEISLLSPRATSASPFPLLVSLSDTPLASLSAASIPQCISNVPTLRPEARISCN